MKEDISIFTCEHRDCGDPCRILAETSALQLKIFAVAIKYEVNHLKFAEEYFSIDESCFVKSYSLNNTNIQKMTIEKAPVIVFSVITKQHKPW